MQTLISSLSLSLSFILLLPAFAVDVEALLKEMTLEEKVGQLTQRLSGPLQGLEATDASGVTPTDRQLEDIRKGNVGSLLGSCGIQNFNRLQKAAMESRLKIPLMVGHDMVHGCLTVAPIPFGLSATWDPDIWYRMGLLIARETPLKGCNWTFSPMIDISRDARWGRIAESPGQDPYLASLYAAAIVKGIQALPPPGGTRVAACLKHFVGYGAAVGGRDYDEVEISDPTLHEVYLPPFEAGVRAGAMTVMPGFHTYNRVPCSVNRYLLTDVLRGELGFKGFCISDHGAVFECGPTGHDTWSDVVDGAAMGVHAGLDQEMTRNDEACYPQGLAQAVRAGKVSMDELDESVRRVLNVKKELGLFEHPYIDAVACSNAVDFEAHLAFCREAAAKSAVLLKNDDDLLPLKPGQKIALLGDLANNESEMRGCWYGFYEKRKNATLLDGLKADGCDVTYTRAYSLTGAVDRVAIARAAAQADVVIACFGEYYLQNGENRSYSDITLRCGQLEALEAIRATGKPLVAVLISGRPMVIGPLLEGAQAVIEGWSPGSCGGWGLADVLVGKAEPYGRLTADFPRTTGQCPLYYNRLSTGRPYDAGKHFWRTHYEDVPFEPQVPFGFGLTYTKFTYANPSMTRKGENYVFAADISNVGSRKGSEVVQVYVRCRHLPSVRPIRELKGYRRVHLQPGETAHVQIEVPVASIPSATFDYFISPDSTR